jgi:hypothetical protein
LKIQMPDARWRATGNDAQVVQSCGIWNHVRRP